MGEHDRGRPRLISKCDQDIKHVTGSDWKVGQQVNEDITGRVKQTAGTIGAIVVLALVAIVLYSTYGVDHEKQASQECWGEFEDVRGEFVLHLNNGLTTSSKDEARRHYQRALSAVTRWHVSHGNIHPEFETVVVDWKNKARSLVE